MCIFPLIAFTRGADVRQFEKAAASATFRQRAWPVDCRPTVAKKVRKKNCFISVNVHFFFCSVLIFFCLRNGAIKIERTISFHEIGLH